MSNIDKLNVAPWKDYAGNAIHEGDHIKHPSGDEGIVVFMPAGGRNGEKWFVDYGNQPYSLLSLQIGSKGQAQVSLPHKLDQPLAL